MRNLRRNAKINNLFYFKFLRIAHKLRVNTRDPKAKKKSMGPNIKALEKRAMALLLMAKEQDQIAKALTLILNFQILALNAQASNAKSLKIIANKKNAIRTSAKLLIQKKLAKRLL